MPTVSKSKTAPTKKGSNKRTHIQTLKKRYRAFMNRRPHRSFRLTRRRDYVRPVELPGNIAFTADVTRLLWKHKGVFLGLVAVYIALYGALVGLQSQELFINLSDTLKTVGGDLFSGNWGAVGRAGLLFVSFLSPNASAGITDTQQLFAVLLFLMAWLTTVWLLRNLLAGHRVKLRDGLYNSGAPLFSTILIALLVAVQLIPVALAVIGYNAASATGLLGGGVATMLFWLAVLLLGALSLYWVTSSLFAMIIVTLPGMYPYQAIRTAGDMVLGRRVKVLLRWLWMALMIVISGFVLIVPIILLDMGLTHLWPSLEWVPIVPIAVLIWSACVAVWSGAYVYMLYRRIVDYAPES